MPLVKIEIRKGKSKEHKKAILNGIHDALVESIKIPEYDRYQRLYELDKDNFECPDTKTDNVTLIQIIMFKGRTLDSKKALYKAIVSNLGKTLGINENDITIVLLEPSLENWCVRDGKLASEIDLGFNIEV